jgi:hypothetical protein
MDTRLRSERRRSGHWWKGDNRQGNPPHPQRDTSAAYRRARAGRAYADPTPPDPADAPDDEDIVVTAYRHPSDIVVRGRIVHCRRRAGDPQDSADASPRFGERRQSVLLPSEGGFILTGDVEPVTGPAFWQRAGTGIDQYVFRAPGDGSPLCIGAKGAFPEGFGQLRRIVDAAPMHGKRVRFTAWVAADRARLVRFWLAAGNPRSRRFNGGNTNNQGWGGSHGWTPVLLEIGPVATSADHISYGFLLYGTGDVWLYDPKLEIVPDGEMPARHGDVAIIGKSEPR